jgi:hypothetical protein
MPRDTDASPDRARAGLVVAATLLGLLGAAALVFGAADGNSTVAYFAGSAQHSAAGLDNAYYRCLNVQVHSLVAPEQPVIFGHQGNGADLLRASGSWLRAAPPSDTSVPELTLAARPGPGSCHGFVVESRRRGPAGHIEVRLGSGDSLAGQGPLPRPTL